MTRTEQARLAAATNQLRPDWPTQSLLTFIANNLAGRAYRDATLALTWIATDPDSHTPARVLEPGPWWQTSRTNDTPRTTNTCRIHHRAGLRTDPATGDTRCAGCWADDHAATSPLEVRQHGVAPPPELRDMATTATRSTEATTDA